jgi:hypothetical protein
MHPRNVSCLDFFDVPYHHHTHLTIVMGLWQANQAEKDDASYLGVHIYGVAPYFATGNTDHY